MSTPTLIGAARTAYRYTARYLHWGIEPEPMLGVLRRIWNDTFARDTVGMLTALLANDWSELDPAAVHTSYRGEDPVPGVGLRLAAGVGPRQAATTEDTEGWLEWMYLIDARTDDVTVYEATRHSRWLLHSRHPLRTPRSQPPARTDALTEYSALGHRWESATITVPNLAGTLAVEVCVSHHPYGMTVARITDDTASAIAAAGPNVGATATLRQAGSDFDLIWPSGAPLQEPMRLPRDEDGQIVIATPWWPWAPTADSTRTGRP